MNKGVALLKLSAFLTEVEDLAKAYHRDVELAEDIPTYSDESRTWSCLVRVDVREVDETEGER